MQGDEVVWTQIDFEGKYANCFRIGFNAYEFLIDFAQCALDSRIAMLHTRIIVSPRYGQVLLALLAKSIDEFEAKYEGTDPTSRM